MGSEYEIYVWVPSENEYRYEFHWSGDTLEEAIKEMKELKELGCMCIRLEWRP